MNDRFEQIGQNGQNFEGPAGPEADFNVGMPKANPRQARPEAGLGRSKPPARRLNSREIDDLVARREAAKSALREKMGINKIIKKAETDQEKLKLRNKARADEEGGVKHLSWEERGKKLDGIIAQIAQEQRKAGLPVGGDGRIKMEDFIVSPRYGRGVVDDDLAEVKNLESLSSKENIGGELMEKITSALFNKYLPELVCARSAEFDDRGNSGVNKKTAHVDTIFFLNGQAVAATDEFLNDGLKNDPESAKKINKIDGINQSGGAGLKYCFRKNRGQIEFGPESNVPAFVLALDSETMNGAIDGLKFGGEENNFEKRAVYKMVGSLYAQIDKLEARSRGNSLAFDARFAGRKNFETRLAALKTYLEQNLPRQDVENYLKEQIEISKTGRKSASK